MKDVVLNALPNPIGTAISKFDCAATRSWFPGPVRANLRLGRQFLRDVFLARLRLDASSAVINPTDIIDCGHRGIILSKQTETQPISRRQLHVTIAGNSAVSPSDRSAFILEPPDIVGKVVAWHLRTPIFDEGSSMSHPEVRFTTVLCVDRKFYDYRRQTNQMRAIRNPTVVHWR